MKAVGKIYGLVGGEGACVGEGEERTPGELLRDLDKAGFDWREMRDGRVLLSSGGISRWRGSYTENERAYVFFDKELEGFMKEGYVIGNIYSLTGEGENCSRQERDKRTEAFLGRLHEAGSSWGDLGSGKVALDSGDAGKWGGSHVKDGRVYVISDPELEVFLDEYEL